MKEYYLVPTLEYEEMKKNCKSDNDDLNMQKRKNLLNNPDLTENNKLVLLNQSIPKPRENVSNKEIEINDLEFVLKDLPSNLHENAHIILNYLKKAGAKLGKYGILSIGNKTVRINELFRSLLIKNSAVSPVRYILPDILEIIPHHLVVNSKVFNIKEMNKKDLKQDERDEYYKKYSKGASNKRCWI